MLVKTLYFYELYETVDITTLEKSYKFVTIINRHFYRQLFPSVMWINSTNLRILTITQREIYVHTIRLTQRVHYNTWIGAFTQRYTTLLLKVLSLVLGVYAYSFWNYVRFLTKETPNKTYTKLSRVLLHVLRPPGVVYVQTSVCAFGGCLVQKSHEPRTVRVTQVRSPKYFRSSHSLRPSTHFVLE